MQPEHTADFAKKRSNGQLEKVDYALYLNGVPVMFFECKAADTEPHQHGGQLSRYFDATPSVKVAVAVQAEAAPEPSKGIVTTQEEIEAFEIVSRICADSTAPVKAPVQYRDAVNYFGINIGNYILRRHDRLPPVSEAQVVRRIAAGTWRRSPSRRGVPRAAAGRPRPR